MYSGVHSAASGVHGRFTLFLSLPMQLLLEDYSCANIHHCLQPFLIYILSELEHYSGNKFAQNLTRRQRIVRVGTNRPSVTALCVT